MNCENSQTLLHGYLDGELDAIRAKEFEQHLEKCSQCIGQLEEQEQLRAALQGAKLYERAPDSLTRKFKRHVAAEEAEGDWSWMSILQWVGASAAIVLLLAISYLGVQGYLAARGNGVEQAALTEVIDAHVRSLQPGHLTDVVSTDQHTVKPWFAGHADVSPPTPDFPQEDYRLIWGRADYIDGHRAAVVVYRHGAHVINVFAWAERDGALPQMVTRNGYHMAFWRSGDIVFCAMSDTGEDELTRLVALLKDASSRENRE